MIEINVSSSTRLRMILEEQKEGGTREKTVASSGIHRLGYRDGSREDCRHVSGLQEQHEPWLARHPDGESPVRTHAPLFPPSVATDSSGESEQPMVVVAAQLPKQIFSPHLRSPELLCEQHAYTYY